MFFYDTTKSATRHWCSALFTAHARSLIRYRRTKRAKDKLVTQ
ncbi:hypothetical protein EPA93_01520 [Ktedonosporobacter rubrisoli]|uniref:Uncharacterized protein n=1 Tax=Ktedonosporobacter rubrisoli TaxID=2509675 RepID=A0A4P6K540_KTERU|nr:hypothetical protein EPA93_01520 [Ktedonosporobacter rubrisoli]